MLMIVPVPRMMLSLTSPAGAAAADAGADADAGAAADAGAEAGADADAEADAAAEDAAAEDAGAALEAAGEAGRLEAELLAGADSPPHAAATRMSASVTDAKMEDRLSRFMFPPNCLSGRLPISLIYKDQEMQDVPVRTTPENFPMRKR